MTRNDLPEPVDPDHPSIAQAMADLEGDLRRMGLGLQADRAWQIRNALYLMRVAGVFPSPND